MIIVRVVNIVHGPDRTGLEVIEEQKVKCRDDLLPVIDSLLQEYNVEEYEYEIVIAHLDE